jgi:hypothetical protein
MAMAPGTPLAGRGNAVILAQVQTAPVTIDAKGSLDWNRLFDDVPPQPDRGTCD